jgi:3-methyladenine DNA glycosylase AlkD
MIVQLAQKHKNCADEDLLQFLPLLKDCATDERNFVKKAVSWALRTLGKRSRYLNTAVQNFAQEFLKSPSAAAQWSARDTLREIIQDKYLERLKR